MAHVVQISIVVQVSDKHDGVVVGEFRYLERGVALVQEEVRAEEEIRFPIVVDISHDGETVKSKQIFEDRGEGRVDRGSEAAVAFTQQYMYGRRGARSELIFEPQRECHEIRLPIAVKIPDIKTGVVHGKGHRWTGLEVAARRAKKDLENRSRRFVGGW